LDKTNTCSDLPSVDLISCVYLFSLLVCHILMIGATWMLPMYAEILSKPWYVSYFFRYWVSLAISWSRAAMYSSLGFKNTSG